MLGLSNLAAFALVSLGMALTPGPNMMYLISHAICQGRRAGLVSLGGVALGFGFYMLSRAGVLGQSLLLGSIRIVISISVNAMIALTAGSIAVFLGRRPVWLLLQRWLTGTVLAGLAVRMATDARR